MPADQMRPAPFSASADRNKDAILNVLECELNAGDHVLEIGSGTAQHILFFARALPQVIWQPSETTRAMPVLQHALADRSPTGEDLSSNINSAIALDVRQQPWPSLQASVAYTANTLHIMDMPAVSCLFSGVASCLAAGGKLLAYGPYRLNDRHISAGNAQFDAQLRAGGEGSGIRDVEALDRLALDNGFAAARQIAMPTSNHLLVWQR